MKRFIVKHWIAITAGIISTRFAVNYAYEQRGYVAIGGEYLILPVIVMSVWILDEVTAAISSAFGKEKTDAEKRYEYSREIEKRKHSDYKRRG